MTGQAIIAQNIRKEIEKRGLKQRYVAELAGFDARSFSNMLTGRKIILAEYIPVIANALGVTPNDLFDTDQTA